MKRQLLAAALLLGMITIPMRAQPPSSRTDGLANGRMWVGMTELEKYSYLIGMTDGVEFTGVFLGDQRKAATVKSLVEGQCSYIEMAEEVTKLYSENPANRVIPIIAVEAIAVMVFGGTPMNAVRQHVENARITWSNLK